MKTINLRPNYENIYQSMIGSVMAILGSKDELTKEDMEALRGQIILVDEIAGPAVKRMERQLQEEEKA